MGLLGGPGSYQRLQKKVVDDYFSKVTDVTSVENKGNMKFPGAQGIGRV